MFFTLFYPVLAYFLLWGGLGLEPVESSKFGGFMLTVTIGVTGIALSLPLGILLALGRRSDLIVLKVICICFIEFIRGVPLITLLFVASTLLNYFLPPGTYFDLLLRVFIMVTLFSAAYIAEVVRGGLAAIPKGQFEAAQALGLNYWKMVALIILPQALKISIPGIVNTFIGLYKDTTLVVVIGLLDPIGLSQAILADSKWQGLSTEIYIFIAVDSSSSPASPCRATASIWRTSCTPGINAKGKGRWLKSWRPMAKAACRSPKRSPSRSSACTSGMASSTSSRTST